MSKPDLLKYINKVKARIRRLGLDPTRLSISNRKDKKYMYELPNNKKIHFGAYGLNDYVMYLHDGNPEANIRRKAYQSRHEKVMLKNGVKAIDVKFSPAWFSWHVLW